MLGVQQTTGSSGSCTSIIVTRTLHSLLSSLAACSLLSQSILPSCCIVQRVLPLSHDGLDLEPDLVHHRHQWEYGARLLYLDAKLIYSDQYLHGTAVTMSVKKACKRVAP